MLLENWSNCKENEYRKTIEPGTDAILICISGDNQAYHELDETSSNYFDSIFYSPLCVVFVDDVGVLRQKAFPKKPI